MGSRRSVLLRSPHPERTLRFLHSQPYTHYQKQPVLVMFLILETYPQPYFP
jgi:hypothetical protein